MSEELLKIKITICQECLNGAGEECHTPGCALFLHKVDLPIDMYELDDDTELTTLRSDLDRVTRERDEALNDVKKAHCKLKDMETCLREKKLYTQKVVKESTAMKELDIVVKLNECELERDALKEAIREKQNEISQAIEERRIIVASERLAGNKTKEREQYVFMQGIMFAETIFSALAAVKPEKKDALSELGKASQYDPVSLIVTGINTIIDEQKKEKPDVCVWTKQGDIWITCQEAWLGGDRHPARCPDCGRIVIEQKEV